MTRSIRNQILIPLVAVQVVTVVTIALVAARLATNRVESQVTSRLEGVVETLGRSNFPLTSGVLDKMRGLSGAHFVASDERGRVIESTLANLSGLPPALRNLPVQTRLDSPGASPKVEIGGEGFFATSIRTTSCPSLVILYPEIAWKRARWEAGLPTLALGFLSLIPMAVMTGTVAHRLSTRLKSVETKVAGIARGDLRDLEERARGDEIDHLIRSVNQMNGQLRELRETIRRTERAGVLAQLAAGLAHQFRNAATGARMAIQLHARRCKNTEGDGSLDVALRQLSLCEEQIKGLLTMGQTSENGAVIVDPGELVNEVLRLVEPACRHVGVRLSHRTELSRPLQADPEAIRAALLNVMLNAVEAAGPNGTVRLESSDHGSFMTFDVIDDGPGPPDELASTLFEPFVTGKAEGVGLGLALASRVATEHGGRLSWDRRDGQTIFSLKIAANQVGEIA